jgi:hypothetical protein
MTRNMRRMRGAARWLAISGSLFGAGACSGTEAEPTPTLAPATSTDVVDPNAGSVDGVVLGDGDYPGYTVQVPPGWSTTDGHFVINDTDAEVLGISVWDVGEVARDPCHSVRNLVDPGPTVEDLVAALVAQPMRHASTPTDVKLGGYEGQYLEWSVPPDMVVTGDADFKGCDAQPNGHRDFVSWLGDGLGERYQQVAGQVDRLWVLDVDGQRLVVDATYSPDASEAVREELGRIAESIRFVDAAA